ncbi:MAG: bifunctional 5,10-methylenetetrahydrofolate dehydrogenase/5,10-methenyltetrahydrofolate cyclohydrolase [Candidatus Paceibacterota bacterium]|jgi:methylenetetrahydrofolate dehydrogenase (NADP+)/methenyltetrahydrofolate cyclohydrolase
MILVNGNKIADEIAQDIKKQNIHHSVKLAVIQVGDDKISTLFINKKKKIAQDLGIDFELFCFNRDASNRNLRRSIQEIAKNSHCHGILVQLPLPKQLNTQYILDTVPPEKDVDVLSSRLLGKFYTGKSSIYPPVVSAILNIFDQYDIKIATKIVVVVGGGRLVGKPLTIALMKEKATVISLNSSTKSIKDFIALGDIVISAAGKPNIITSDMLKKGAIVIDAGLSVEKLSSGKHLFKGDVAFGKDLNKKISLFVPAVGGIGPITVVMVMKNLFKLANS